MGVDRVALRALFGTLTAIFLLVAFMFTTLVWLYPSTMMEFTYKLGMDKSSISYAERAYDWSGDEYFMAFAMEVAIGSKDNEKIESCGVKLLSDEDFTAYYEKKNESVASGSMTYETYVYGQVCVAKYKNGKKQDAVESAFAWTEGFSRGNAITAVLYTALSNTDAETIASIRGKMEQMQADALSSNEKAEFDRVFALTNG